MKRAVTTTVVLAVLVFACAASAGMMREADPLTPWVDPTGVRTVAPGATYSNITNYLVAGFSPGGATGSSGLRLTRMVADDITFLDGARGNPVTALRFGVRNFNGDSFAPGVAVAVYADDNGAPGAKLAFFNFGTIGIPRDSMAIESWTLSSGSQFNVPASGKIWAGIFFYISGTAGPADTDALNQVGAPFFNPVDVGSSADRDFYSANAGGSDFNTFNVNSPPGSVRNAPFGAQGSIANYGWEFMAAPEPGGLILLGFSASALKHRRKTR